MVTQIYYYNPECALKLAHVRGHLYSNATMSHSLSLNKSELSRPFVVVVDLQAATNGEFLLPIAVKPNYPGIHRGRGSVCADLRNSTAIYILMTPSVTESVVGRSSGTLSTPRSLQHRLVRQLPHSNISDSHLVDRDHEVIVYFLAYNRIVLVRRMRSHKLADPCCRCLQEAC
jgi:hypothetical protein